METRGLSFAGCREAARSGGGCGTAFAPYFAPIERWFAATDPRPRGELDLVVLNRLAGRRALRTASGKAIRFVDARSSPRGAYERIVHDTGCVPTRTRGAGMLHDWFNALAWLAFPRTKGRLNDVHVQVLDRQDTPAGSPGDTPAGSPGDTPTGSPGDRLVRTPGDARAGRGRGRVRDAATLFDESGAVFVCGNAFLRDALVARDWPTLFVRERAAFAHDASVVVFGHALFEKLLDPYKSICAQSFVLASAPVGGRGLDAALAARIGTESLAAGSLHPLPLLGVPGWCDANSDPSFYDDASVFRRGRRRSDDAAG